MVIDEVETGGTGGAADGDRSVEDLAALPMRDLLTRRAAHDTVGYDAIINQRSERFFRALNQWLPTADSVFAGIENVLTVENWKPFGRDTIIYQCGLGIDRGYLVAALLNVLDTLGLAGMMPDVIDGKQISLIFPADSLDVSDMGILVERARARCEAKRLTEEARGQRPVGPEVGDVAAEVRGAAVVAAAAAVEHGPEDSGEESG